MSFQYLEANKKNNGGEGGDKVRLEHLGGYRFKITFPDAEKTTLMMDEPPPLGEMRGPNAARVLAASIANCLSASLIFCLNKSKIPVKNMSAEAEPIVLRNEKGYWRVTKVNVSLYPELADDADQTRIRRCLDVFENYCVVTGAVRNGLGVDVKVSMPANPNSSQDAGSK
ncbi:MAG TPA: OsmC family protein [Nitrososphaerales archaeon]|nr:OsmC family protein [Nitrososphaerales archaeon]